MRVERTEHCTLYLGDCLEVLPTLGKVDAVVTDPPYGIGASEMTLGTGAKRFFRGEWDRSRPSLIPFLDLGCRCCFWGGNYFSDELPSSPDWLVWHKRNDGLSFSECELAWTNFGNRVRHISHNWGGEEKQHPTQKPLAVMLFSLEHADGETVFDPFMGSGTTGVACIKTGRRFIGIEKEPKYFEIALKRIREAERLAKCDLFKEDKPKMTQREFIPEIGVD